MTESIFDKFMGQQVKVTYRDGKQFKIARGVLEEIQDGFIRVTGRLGTIIINEQRIEKMAKSTKK